MTSDPWPKRIGTYLVRREIGRGGMGIVYEVEHEGTRRLVALKVLPGTVALDREAVERFRREARASAQLNHPAVVPIYEIGHIGGVHFTVMKLMPGTSLETTVRTLPRDRRLALAGRIAEVADALEAAHQAGIVHRDVKPANLLFREDGGLALSDFGLAKLEGAATVTLSGQILGTPKYMSPEQVESGEADVRSDVYSLGVTLWEVLTGRPAVEGDTVEECLRSVREIRPQTPRALNPDVSPELAGVVLKAMSKEPVDRYASARDFGEDLRRALQGEPVKALPETGFRSLVHRAQALVRRFGFGWMGLSWLLAFALAGFLTSPLWYEQRTWSLEDMKVGLGLSNPLWAPVALFGVGLGFLMTAWGLRIPSRWRPADVLILLLAGCGMGVLCISVLSDLWLRPLPTPFYFLGFPRSPDMVLRLVLTVASILTAIAAWGIGATRTAWAAFAAAILVIELRMGWMGPLRMELYLAAASCVLAAGLWRPVGERLAGLSPKGWRWGAVHLLGLAAVTAGWLVWIPKAGTFQFARGVLSAANEGPLAEQVQWILYYHPDFLLDDRVRDLERRDVQLAEFRAMPRSFDELVVGLKSRWGTYKWIALADPGEADLERAGTILGRDVASDFRTWLSRMQDDLHVHRAYNPPVRNRGSWAHDRLADVLSGRDDPGEVDLFPPERVTRMMEPPTEWSLGGEKFQSWWWELKLFVHARTPETTDDFFTPYLKHSSARVRTVARALLARRSPARRGPLLEAQLAEDHFDRYPTLAYWALQELVQDEKDSSRLSEWRSKHWGDVCRFVVDCVRYGKGAEDPAATITRFSASFKRNSEEWKFGYEYQFDYIVDAVCRRKDKSALPLLKTFFDKGWVELAAPVLALHDEGRDFLRTVLDRKDPPNLGGEGGMFAAEAVRAERIAAAWALGQSDRVAEEWKKMSTRIRSCDICMSLKYRVARSTGDETAARDAGVELLDMMDSNSRWPLPRALDLLDDVRGLVQKHGLPTD